MPSIEYRYCSFSENLIEKVAREQPAEGTVFVHPTEISKKNALRQFHKNWQWSATLFVVMEEFKDGCFPCALPLLKEEKRTLAFYAALAGQERQKFKIQNYFQSIELAHNFFTLWEECNEEVLSDSIDFNNLQNQGLDVQDWQQDLYQQLLLIKESYGRFIHDKGFEDSLFTHRPEQIDLQEYASYNRIVFVNQFYYTRLEKALIQHLQALEKQVVIYYQLDQRFIKTPQLENQIFSFGDFQSFATQRVTIHESKNDFSMMAALSQRLSRNSITTIVDNTPTFNPYYRFLSFSKIRMSLNQPFPQSTIYRFVNHLYALMDSLVPDLFDPRQQLLPLQALLDTVTDPVFYRYFCPPAQVDPQVFCELGLRHLYQLINQDFKYIDLKGDFFFLDNVTVRQAKNYLLPVLGLLQKALAVQSMDDFLQLIDTPAGVRIKEIISDEERAFSDILDEFYQTLADFSAIEALGLVDEWQDVFSPNNPANRQAISRGWFRLFLEYLKPQRIHFSTVEAQGPRIEVTSLLDTWNLNYESVAVINVREGVLPQPPTTPFLFNEHQRKKLGLTSYEQIRLREKYYFTRLVLNTPEVHLFTQKNIDKNIEISSFLEELMLHFDAPRWRYRISGDDWCRRIYQVLLPTGHDPAPAGDHFILPSFFVLPFNQKQDYPDHAIALSFYEYKSLAEHPFIYYIRHLLHIEPRPEQISHEFSPPFIGKLTHDILNTIWRLYMEDLSGMPGVPTWTQICDAYIDKSLNNFMLEKKDNRYKIPHNHSLTYFNEIYWPILRTGIRSFFTYLENVLHLKMDLIRIYPESEFSNPREREGLPFLTLMENNTEWIVKIKGRADLRLETTNNERQIIFDYKTGAIDPEQLVFYELFYYLIENPDMEKTVSSFGYDIVKRSGKELRQFYKRREKFISKRQVREDFTARLRSLITGIVQNGFDVGSDKKIYPDWRDIVRVDLFQ